MHIVCQLNLIMSDCHRKSFQFPKTLGCSPVSHADCFNLALSSPLAPSLTKGFCPLYSSHAYRLKESFTYWFSISLFSLSPLSELPIPFLFTWETSLFLSLEVFFRNLLLILPTYQRLRYSFPGDPQCQRIFFLSIINLSIRPRTTWV